ncbi:hypothetical protein HPB49_005858 [Dermacentor silvarum]|uniref:Uncharacterized protein n=1 Tax=Dermacentor silvarum TaxID=543639 RepID=A0ACB8CVQ0_DERSI|nr:hypothetical protein HPB49_005858 [Dermacentor silvarum]
MVLEEFERHASKKGGRYEVPLLMRELDLAKYDKTIQTYFDECDAERVPDQDVPFKPNTYYMPHHGVIRRNAVTTKLLVVFDASPHAPGQPVLNPVLIKGPKMDADLLKLLLNFMFHPIVMVADIKKAYLQMVIRPEDRDALRFLWIAHLPTQHQPLRPIVQWRMTRVSFGATSSPFLLAATLHYHFSVPERLFPDTVACLKESFYVDDLVVGALCGKVESNHS